VDQPSQGTIATSLSKIGQVNPLLIILSFVLLTEVVVMFGILGTTNLTQMILASFIVVFPVLVAILFFWILATKPWAFYAPKDYGVQTDPQSYINAVANTSIPRISSEMNEFIMNLGVKVERALQNSEQLRRLINAKEISEIGRDVVEEIRENELVTIDLTEFGGKTVVLPVNSKTNVDELLDYVYYEINKVSPVPPFAYRSNWVLQDIEGNVLEQMGTQWARENRMRRDTRPLPDANIQPGAQLKAVKL
jgi:hypothetical protein